MWLKDPTPQNKEQYQSARDACKQVIKHAQEKAWSEYGNQLEDMRKTEAMKSFYLEPKLSENQFGIRKNKGCSDAIFILRQLQEKHIEWNTPLYMAFIDQENAFDRVVREELWKCLAERSIFGELLRVVQSLFICGQAALRTRE